MNYYGDTFIIFSVILIIAFMIPEFFSRFKVTYIPFYIVSGMLLGPYGLGQIGFFSSHHIFGWEVTQPLQFVADLGLLLLVFLAGLEIHYTMDGSYKNRESLWMIAIFGVICFLSGFFLGILFSLSLVSSLLLGTVLTSSSVAEIISIVNSTPPLKHKFGNVISPTIITLDAASLTALGIILMYRVNPGNIGFFIIEVFLLLAFVFYFIPIIARRYFQRKSRKPRESDMKFVLVILITVVAISEFIGLHGIVAAFIVGVALGEFVPPGGLYDKIHGLGHGLLIPVFFIILGMSLDFSIFSKSLKMILFPVTLISVLMGSKVLSGVVYSLLSRYRVKDGILLGVSLWPQMSATLAAAAIGHQFGIFNSDVLISIVLMAIFSVLATPFIIGGMTREKITSIPFQNHTVILGFGRTSSKIVTILSYARKEFIVVDKELSKVKKLERRGINVIYGNGADKEVLKRAGVQTANVVLITIPDEHEEYLTAVNIRVLNPDCYIIAKIHTEKLFKTLKSNNLADSFIWPEKMSSLEATKRVFEHLEGSFPDV